MQTKILLIFIVLLGFSASAHAADWESLFDGESLDGWQQLGGNAGYEAVDGAIVGTSVPDSPNSFLATRDTYGDFILEFEVKVHSELNSGVQFRSDIRDDGMVYGYQAEIDPSPRAYSGGIYDEKRRKWLYPLGRNENGRKAFRNGIWNHYRVEAVGTSLRVWVNGIQASELVDAETAEGFIALQVHSLKDPALAGTTVRWRNLRIMTQDLEANRKATDPDVVQISFLINELTAREEREGWRLLWDGQSSNGWRGAKLTDFPESGWTMEDGVLSVEASDGGESTGPGDIVTLHSFSDFELQFEFRITDGANSGVKYFVDPNLNLGPGSAIGCEFQILDDRTHPDAKMGVNGNRTLGSLYDLITAENLSAPTRGKTFKGIGVWNQGRIVSKGGRVEHWLNSEKVVEYNRNSQMFRALVAYSKYKDWEGFGQWPEGRILLQDHGDDVSFRSIKIREF